jgi:chemotaxis protein methyltransferase CheR
VQLQAGDRYTSPCDYRGIAHTFFRRISVTFDSFLHEACPALDLAWRKYRRRSARHRVEARIRELGLENYGDYLQLLRSDAVEAAALSDLMRVTVTRFFREQKAWRALADIVLPQIMRESASARTLQAWSAGCCGGEEPFSLALCWLTYLQPSHPLWSLAILATDIDDASIMRANRALYSLGSLREVPHEIRDRRFSKADSRWLVDREARGLVTFQKRHLLLDPAPRDMDLVLCRYLVFTY